MAPPPPGERARDLSLLVFGVALLLFATPLRLIWAEPGRPWYLPFVPWLCINLLVYLAAKSSSSHET